MRSAKRLGGAAEGRVNGGMGCEAERKEKATMESQSRVSASASQTKTIMRQSGIPVFVASVVVWGVSRAVFVLVQDSVESLGFFERNGVSGDVMNPEWKERGRTHL